MKRTALFLYAAAALFLIISASAYASLPGGTSIPQIGNQACLECHEDHSLEGVGNIHYRIRPSELRGTEMSCESCHGSGTEHMEEGDPSKILSFSTATPEAASKACLKCHESLQTMDWKLSDHSMSDVACTSCHSIHSEKSLIKPDPLLCFDCHSDVKVKSYLPSHHPVRETRMTCSSCHQHHGSLVQNMKTTERMNDLCYNCHTDKQGPFIFEHAPVLEDCSICHDPHGTVGNNLLKQNEPFICLQCHESHFHAGRIGVDHPKTLPAGGYSANPFGEAGWRVAYLTKCTQCHFRIHGTDNPSQTVPGKGKGLIR